MALLATKLYIPSARPGLLSRSRLAEQLNLDVLSPLALIFAPAGYGKTTLLSTWAATCGYPVAWLTPNEGDNDPVRFWRYVGVAFWTVINRLSESLHSNTTLAQAFSEWSACRNL
jgi:LuxR family maltose regulon positive regulatory protein